MPTKEVNGEPQRTDSIFRTSWSAVASLAIPVIWSDGGAATLGYGLLTHDLHGWNWLPYIVWGPWGLTALISAFLLAVWSLWCIRTWPP